MNIRNTIITGLVVATIFLLNGSSVRAARLYFEPSNVNIAPNQTFSVNIMVDTEGAAAGGSSAKLSFDPNFLRLTQIENKSVPNSSEKIYCPDRVFTDYPHPRVENSNGVVVITGIVSSINNLYNGSGVFCRVTFQALSEGSTSIDFDHTQGDTTDSNVAVTYGNGDALSSVGSLDVNINSAAGVGGDNNNFGAGVDDTDEFIDDSFSTTVSEPAESGSFITRFFNMIKKKLGLGGDDSVTIDPYAPITSMPSEVRTSPTQPEYASSTKSPVALIGLAIGVILLLVVIRMIVKKLRKSREPVIRNDIQM